MDNADRLVVTREAPGWPTYATVYGENGEAVRVEVTGQEIRLAMALLAAAQMGERK